MIQHTNYKIGLNKMLIRAEIQIIRVLAHEDNICLNIKADNVKLSDYI